MILTSINIFVSDFSVKLVVELAKVCFNHPKSRPSVIIIQFFFNYSLASINKIPNFGWKSEKYFDFKMTLQAVAYNASIAIDFYTNLPSPPTIMTSKSDGIAEC